MQAFLYSLLQGEEEATALRALAVLSELHRRNVWRDARTVNVIGECIQSGANHVNAHFEEAKKRSSYHAATDQCQCAGA